MEVCHGLHVCKVLASTLWVSNVQTLQTVTMLRNTFEAYEQLDIDYRIITVEIISIPAVNPQWATPSLRYNREFHLQNCRIPAVLLPSLQGSNHILCIIST